ARPVRTSGRAMRPRSEVSPWRASEHVIEGPLGASAAIMAGGKSTRMGQDKAWIELDGEPLIKRVANVLAEVADEVIVVANDPRYESLGLRVVRDRYPQGGALGGIATGVGAADHDTVLVAACDMPFLSADVWRML